MVDPTTFAELIVREVSVASVVQTSMVPEATRQGRNLDAQAISALHVGSDDESIFVGTMAFSHEANIWQFSSKGDVLGQRYFAPWAPMQIATVGNGRAMAIGLAYSRVTSPDPTVWLGARDQLFEPTLADTLAESDDREGEFARLRPGEGPWASGWYGSLLGELFVSGPNWLFKPPRTFMDNEGRRRHLSFETKDLLPASRSIRMAATPDGRHLAFGWVGFPNATGPVPQRTNSVQLWTVNPNGKLWSVKAASHDPPVLPDPRRDFPDLAKAFRLGSHEIIPGFAAASVALNADASRVAIVEYGIWGWVRKASAIGKWDPPIHVLNFLPRQRGRLRVFDGKGKELFSQLLPDSGLFDVGFSADNGHVWCWPASWFSRGMAGEPWLPVDKPANKIYRVHLGSGTADAVILPDAVAQCALTTAHARALVSCWDGWIYILTPDGKLQSRCNLGRPARVAWSHDGKFALAGTTDGRLLRINEHGKVAWTRKIPEKDVPPPKAPSEVVPGLPIFQGGRIPGGEHAYVGDIWMIKVGAKAIFVDAGGISGFSTTQARLRALAIDDVTHVLQTHTHGDHCGGAYLWRAAGAMIVGPKAAAFSQTWLMPMLTDYGIYPPSPLDLSLPLTEVGDEVDFEVSGLKFRGLYVPGHSLDLTVYMTVFGGKRIAFTGDLGFENQDILHRCWGDRENARKVLKAISDKLLPWNPDIVFTGHGVRTNGLEFLTSLVRQTEASLLAE